MAVSDKEVTDFFTANRSQVNLAEASYANGQNGGTPGARRGAGRPSCILTSPRA